MDNLLTTTIAATGIVATLGTTMVGVVKNVPKQLFNLFKQRIGYSISTDSLQSISIFGNINKWLLSLNKSVLNNHINTKSEWNNGNEIIYETLDYGKYTILYKGCILTIDRYKNQSNDGNMRTNVDYISIYIYGFRNKAKELQQEILDTTNEKYVNKKSNSIMSIKFDQYSAMIETEIPKRSFETIYNPNIDRIKYFLNKWVENKPIYINHGLPYKTGILLYGEPGTGKSSIARAVASYLDFNLMVVTATQDLDAIRNIPGNTVIALEDIDAFIKENRYDEDKKEGKENRLSMIFNIIDGPLSPDNIVFIATTNKKESLDKALIRKSRFDLQLEIEALDEEYAVKMVEDFGLEPKDILQDVKYPVLPCDLQEKILNNL